MNEPQKTDESRVQCSALLCRALERMEARRDWLKGRQANALENGRLLDAGGWQCRAGGVADAIDILKALEEESRHNDKLSHAGPKT